MWPGYLTQWLRGPLAVPLAYGPPVNQPAGGFRRPTGKRQAGGLRDYSQDRQGG